MTPLTDSVRLRRAWRGISPVVPLLILAWFLYQPAETRPFDYVDFPENIVVLQDNDGFVAGIRALSEVYANHGRWSPINTASIAAQWTVFGSWTPGWQLTRFILMAVVTALAFKLYRRLGLPAAAALAAVTVLVVSPPAAVGWLRLSTAESLCLLFVTLGCLAALAPAGRSTKVKLSAVLLATVWTKEIATAAFALPLLLAICRQDDGSLGAPRWNRHTLALIGVSAVTLFIGALPVLGTLFSSPSDSFAMRYASTGLSPEDIFGASLAAWIPFAPVPERSMGELLIVGMAFLTLLVIGWREALRPPETRTHRRVLLILAVLVPLLGAAVYAPWPFYLLVYALPFALAGALLPGTATAGLIAAGTPGRVIAAFSIGIVISYGAAQSFNESARTRALHRVVAESVAHMSALHGVDSVFVEVAGSQFDPAGNFGPRFRRYARMLDASWPEVRDIPCGGPTLTGWNFVRLRLNVMCEADGGASDIVARYVRVTWPNPIPRADSVTATFTRGAQ